MNQFTLRPRNGTTVALREHTFRILAPHASEVLLVGDFNNWNANQNGTLTKDAHGWWSLKLNIPNRPQHYLFVVDR